MTLVVICGPGSSHVTFCACQGRDVVDVDRGSNEEDALNGILGEGLAGRRVDSFHFEGYTWDIWICWTGYVCDAAIVVITSENQRFSQSKLFVLTVDFGNYRSYFERSRNESALSLPQK